MKNIIRPLRILINKDNQRPYIIYKNKKYYVDNLNKKEILKLIKGLSKKFKRKKIKNRKQIKKDINKNLTGIITSKIYEGYVNNQLSNKLDNINKDIIQINNKINENKKMIDYVDNNKNILKYYNSDDLYKLENNGNYRFYLNNTDYLEADDKNKLKKIVSKVYKNYIKLQNDNKELQTLNLSNISKIEEGGKIVKDIKKDIDDLQEDKFNIEEYLFENVIPMIEQKQDIKQSKKIKKEDIKEEKKTSKQKIQELFKEGKKRAYKKKNKNILQDINPEIEKTEQQKEDYGEGLKKYINNRGIYTNEIKDIMKNIKFFLDVINIDDLNKLVDDIINNKLYKCCFIMNNNKEHWIACYIDLINDHEINYYDCLGNKAPDIFKNEMKRLIESLNIDVYIKYKENLIKNQPDNSLLCAFYCISFILQRLAGLEFKYITNYKNLNENNIKELKKKYEKFKFI